jgi:sensor histidine kinase YesM
MEEGGKISILVDLEKDFIVIEMLDTGPGIAPSGIDGSNVGIGLRNTVDRLQGFYGDNYTFNLKTRSEGGLHVYMRLPLEKQVK